MRRVSRLLGLAAVAAVLSIPTPAVAEPSSLPPIGDDYPAAALYAAHPELSDADIRQCGTFALWRVDRDHGRPPFDTTLMLIRAHPFTGAADIDDAARAAGLRVDHTPAVGAIAVLEPYVHEAGPHGHAAYVARVYADGAVLVEHYNWDRPHGYERNVVPSTWASSYVHF